MTNYENMRTEDLLMEKCHLEQQRGAVAEDNLYIVNELIQARFKAQKEAKQAEDINNHVINVEKTPCKWGSKDADMLQVGDWIVTEAYQKLGFYHKEVERITDLRETNCFMVANGKRIKKNSHRITFHGFK